MLATISMSAAVGNKGRNLDTDVQKIQKLLNTNIHALGPLLPLKVDGRCGPITIGMIVDFQRRLLRMSRPDGRVDPIGRTLNALNERSYESPQKEPPIIPAFDTLLLKTQHSARRFSRDGVNEKAGRAKDLTEGDYVAAAALLGVDVPIVKAVAAVESRGAGFLSNGKPKILFEGHWFSRLTKGKYDSSHPSISYSKWTKRHYLGGTQEYTRYNAAAALDMTSAMKSTSWGKFQIMGFNYAKAGYSSIENFVRDMNEREAQHLNAFVNFLKSTGLDAHLKAKNWTAFAKGYNGPKYVENQYDIKLAQAYKVYSAE